MRDAKSPYRIAINLLWEGEAVGDTSWSETESEMTAALWHQCYLCERKMTELLLIVLVFLKVLLLTSRNTHTHTHGVPPFLPAVYKTIAFNLRRWMLFFFLSVFLSFFSPHLMWAQVHSGDSVAFSLHGHWHLFFFPSNLLLGPNWADCSN